VNLAPGRVAVLCSTTPMSTLVPRCASNGRQYPAATVNPVLMPSAPAVMTVTDRDPLLLHAGTGSARDRVRVCACGWPRSGEESRFHGSPRGSAVIVGYGSMVPRLAVSTSVPGGCWTCKTTFI
jgi:hypothetical protein